MTVARDTVIYMLAKAVEGVLGILTLSVYTHLFASDMLGRYNLVNQTIITAGPLCLLWLQQGMARYVNAHEVKNDTKRLYSTVFFTWLTISLVILAVGAAAISLLLGPLARMETIEVFLTNFKPHWLWLALLGIPAYGASQLTISVAGVRRRISLTLVLSLFAAFMKLLIPLALSRGLGRTAAVEWLLITNLFCDVAIAVFGSYRLGLWKEIKLSAYARQVLVPIAAFGVPLIGNFITTTVLNNSDRFLIAAFTGLSDTGIYTINYGIASAAMTMLTFAASRGSYPNILKSWATGDKAQTIELISQAVRLFLLLTLPAAVGLATLSPRISALFEESYHAGFAVIPWVSFGLLLLGLTEYSNKHWELSANTKIIFRNSAISGLANIVLNILLLPRFGYLAAAVSTFLGFLLYFLLSKLGSRKHMKWTLPALCYVRIFAAAAVMGCVVLALSYWLPASVVFLPVLIAAGAAVYAVILCASGELMPEVRFILNTLKRGKDASK